jgi:hypothetical protein
MVPLAQGGEGGEAEACIRPQRGHDKLLALRPVRTHKRGAAPKDGPLFQGKRPETHKVPAGDLCFPPLI